MRQILIFTGDGKGKTSAAIGTAVRALGHEHRVLVIQFMKECETGEMEFLKNLENVRFHQSGAGFFTDPKAKKKHEKAAQEGLELLEKELADFSPNLVILDEINVACSLEILDPEIIVKILRKNPETSFILTGRNAPREFLDIANLVTKMREIKHPFQEGKKAQKGIDF